MNDLPVQVNVDLAPLTTLKIGGRARFFVKAVTEKDVVDAVQFANERGLSIFILGGGSNILVSDDGFNGLVLQISLKGIISSEFRVPSSEFRLKSDPDPKLENRNSKLITVAAGENWDAFVNYCVGHNYAGVECLSGIPGSVGGTPVQNVGAYGQEVAETIVDVRVFDRESETIRTLSNADCGFTYRGSTFNTTARDKLVVLSVTFGLQKDGEPTVKYRDLREHFAGRTPILAETREAVLTIRRSKSMVIDAGDPNSLSAGSFFKNPIVSREKFDALSYSHPKMPSFPTHDEQIKIPAAWLVETAGFHKALTLGNFGISSRHTLAIINRGGASASDIITLKNAIQSAVKAKFDVLLQPEPIFVGF